MSWRRHHGEGRIGASDRSRPCQMAIRPMFSPHSRARNFRLLATLTLLAVAPGLVVIIVLSARGGATLLELLLGVVITLGGAAGVNLILLRDLTRLQGWVQSLLEQTSGPPRSPDLSTEPARLLELTIARVMRGSRN